MSRIARVIAVVALCILSVTTVKSWADNQASFVDENKKSVAVEINYGDLRPSRTVEVPRAEGKTVLETLQVVATVETHPVGQYIMVTSIDGVEGKRGEMAWYYTVDGESADKIAYSKKVDDAKHIKWDYKKDVCSEKVCSVDALKEEN